MDQNMKQQADAALAKWAPLSVSAEEAHLNAPIHAFPGLFGVSGGPGVTPGTANEIRELQLAIAAAHSEYLVLVQALADKPLDRADFVLSEIRSALTFVFDDGKHDEADERLSRLQQTFADSSSQDGMALALEGYAELAGMYLDDLSKLEDFDVSFVEEARVLAAALREQSATALTCSSPIAQRQALALRNRLLTLLNDRVRRVRRTAQYVFRNYPDVVRKFTSAYERRQRTARRRTEKERENRAAVEARAGAMG